MNKPLEQNATNGGAKTLHLRRNNGAPIFTKLGPTVQDIVNQVKPMCAIKGVSSQVPAKDAVNAPPLAAKGDDDVMSQQQKPS